MNWLRLSTSECTDSASTELELVINEITSLEAATKTLADNAQKTNDFVSRAGLSSIVGLPFPREAIRQIGVERIHTHPILLHGIAIPNRYFPVSGGLKVVGNAKRRSHLILTAVAFADAAGLVKVANKLPLERGKQGHGRLEKLLGERQERHFDRSNLRGELEYHAGLPFHLFLVIGIGEHNEEG